MNNTLKVLTLVGKVAGALAGVQAVPFVSPHVGLCIFAGASILKDVVNRIGDFMDDGKENQSFRS